MKKIVIEIDDCWQCPYSHSKLERNSPLECKKSNLRKIKQERREEENKIIFYPIPVWCPQLLEKQTH